MSHRQGRIQRKKQLAPKCPRTGKKYFRSAEQAERALEDASWWREHGDEQRQERRVYECEYCAGFHLTSQPKPLERSGPVKPVSSKRAKEQRQRSKVLAEVFGATPPCARCGGPADDAHELLSRARGGSITDPTNIVPLCRADHRWITEHPAEAAAEGWALSRKDSA